jgi:hypothetical protein
MNIRTIGIRVMTAAILLAGCSSSSSPADGGGTGGGGGAGNSGSGGAGGNAGGGAAAALAGTWTFQDPPSSQSPSTLQANCPSAAIPDLDLGGDVLTITEVDATHVHVSSTNGINCEVNFGLRSGTTSIFDAAAGQMCTATIGGTRATVNITSWDLSLTAGTITTMLNGTVTSPVSCSPVGMGTLTK